MDRLELREPQPVKTKVFVSSTSMTAFSRHWLVSYQKILSEPQSGHGSFLPFVFSSRGFFSVNRDPHGWSMIYHRWRVVHYGTTMFQIHALISKGRTALFRHFGRMLHLAP